MWNFHVSIVMYPEDCATVRSDMEVPEEPLLEDRIPPGFPDDQICNLLDHDGNKESRITCVF